MAKNTTSIDDTLQDFMAGEDVVLDQYLLLLDIQASAAHVDGLAAIDVLTDKEAKALKAALQNLAQHLQDGAFVLDQRFEDGHSAIESYLTDKLGDTGKKVHTGRSRNDQVLVASRLYLRDRFDQLFDLCQQIARSFLNHASKHQNTAMPGYTHLQRAVPSSVGMWAAGFAESFLDNALLVQQQHHWINSCPLGTAAGYGSTYP